GMRGFAGDVGMERTDVDGCADLGHSARTRYRRRHGLRPFQPDADSLVPDGRLSPEFDVDAPAPVVHLELGWILVEPPLALDLASALARRCPGPADGLRLGDQPDPPLRRSLAGDVGVERERRALTPRGLQHGLRLRPG